MPKKRKEREKARSLEAWAEAGREEKERMLLERGPLPRKEPMVRLPLASPELGAPWIASAGFVLRHGRPVIRELHIQASPEVAPWDIPPTGLTTRHLRSVWLGTSALDEIAAELFRKAGIDVPRKRLAGTRRGRYQRISDDEAAGWANDYLAAVRKQPDSPRKWLLEQYAKKGHVTEGDVRERIRIARQRGFLTPARYAGDRLPSEATDKLNQWNQKRRRGKKQ